MTGRQKAVLWLGLILIGLNLVSKWSEIKSVIFQGSGITAPPGTGLPGSTGGKPAFPFLPNIPGITGKVPIIGLLGQHSSQPQHQTKKATLL
jgi:hypothetical protein